MKLISFFIALCFSSLAFSQNSKYTFPQGNLELLQSQKTLGLHFKLNPDWHIYWKNSGDSGAAPLWSWKFVNAKLESELWPAPQRIPVAGLTNIGYSNDSLFLFKLNVEGKASTNLDLEFLVCKVECIPYFVKLRKEFLVSDTDQKFDELIKKFNYPNSDLALKIPFVMISQSTGQIVAELDLPFDVKNLEIFPEDGLSFQAVQPKLDPDGRKVKVTLALQTNSRASLDGAKFLVVADENSFEVSLKKSETSFFMILFWALLGGIILNLMPCVLPVLSIKMLSFVDQTQSAQKLRLSGWLYTLGVLISFLTVGAVLLILRASGEQIGWGFQLQSPIIAASLALLFLWVGFNFLGFFEVGQSLANAGSQKKSGAFLTGVLATVVATPCTAPFMGAALGASLTLPYYQTMFVFLGLGVGLAIPFLVLSYMPQALKFLPKPGQWMVTLKEFLAFPMFVTVIWLLWVLSQQIETNGLLLILLVYLFVGFWIWFSKKIKNEVWQQRLLILGFLISIGILFALPLNPPQQTKSVDQVWQNFSPDKIKEDLVSKKSVFIDFTAAWCITCQVNKKAVLETEEIQSLFRANGVSIYKADWTHRDPIITKALADFGRNSLPLYVFYQTGSDQAIILPELLTKSMIKNLFNN